MASSNSYSFLRNLESCASPTILTEGLVGIEVIMIIDEVKKAGKFTNPVQVFMFAKLVAALKDGSVTTVPELASSLSTETSSTVIKMVKELPSEQVCALAEFLSKIFSYRDKEFIWPTHCVEPSLCAADWITKYVILSREDSRD